jgi:hypothetical protein
VTVALKHPKILNATIMTYMRRQNDITARFLHANMQKREWEMDSPGRIIGGAICGTDMERVIDMIDFVIASGD